MFDQSELESAKRDYDAYRPQPQQQPAAQKKKTGWLRGQLMKFLPMVAGGAGAAIGTVAGPAGTLAGGAVGSGLGEFLRQKLSGEKTSLGGISRETAFGAVPGAFRMAKAVKGAVKSGEGVRGAVKSTMRTPQTTEAAMQETLRTNKLAQKGKDMRQSIVNPQVAAAVGGAQKEAQIAERAMKVPGLSGKTKYANLQAEMDALNTKIEPQLAKAKGTVNNADLITTVRNNAEQSSHFLAGDAAYEKQLSSVLADLTTKTKGTGKLTAKQMYDYKKGMDMNSVFNKLEKGADLNPKEAARLAVWSSLDEGITKAAPGVKELTKEQSLLIQSAPGLKKSANKTLGVPLLGIKSQKAEQVLQGARELTGRGLEKVSQTSSTVAKTPGFRPFMGTAKATVPQAGSRAAGSLLFGTPFVSASQPPQNPAETPLDQQPLNLPTGSSQEPTMGTEIYPLENLQADIQRDPANAEAYLKIYKATATTPEKPLSAEAAKVVSNAQAGLGALDIIERELTQDPSIQGKSAFSGTFNPFGLTSRALGTGEYENARQQAIDVIARIRTGAAVTKEEAQRFAVFLPQPGDSPETISQKLNILRQQFQMVANRSGAAGTDLQNSLV